MDANAPLGFERIPLVTCRVTRITFEGETFEITRAGNEVTIEREFGGLVKISHKNQKVHYKASVLGGTVLREEESGEAGYSEYFSVDWEDDLHLPALVFKKPPRRITRAYRKGQRIELGLEDVSLYHLKYEDGVEADFERAGDGGFSFSFSTGFHGSFREEKDGAYTIRFKGDRLTPGEDDYPAQSKFIISRSKYTGKPLLILQDDAVVDLR